jgi:hypothetical protein
VNRFAYAVLGFTVLVVLLAVLTVVTDFHVPSNIWLGDDSCMTMLQGVSRPAECQ